MRIEVFYEVAKRSGLLTCVVFAGQEVWVDFQAPDEEVLSGLGLSRNYTLRYPQSWLAQLAIGDTLEIAGASYRVREIRQLRDGSEVSTTLSRV